MALVPRSLSCEWSAPPLSLVSVIAEHTFSDEDCAASCNTLAQVFSPHLGLFGGNVQIAQEALRGLLVLDEARVCPRARLGQAISWRNLASPPLAGIPNHLHEQFLSEWIKIFNLHEDEYVENVFNDDVTLFHGTIAKCALKIIEIGFLPGPNGHVKNRRYYQGAFMAKEFNAACYRSDMTRHVQEDGIYDFQSCPCVLEIRTSSLLVKNYHKSNPDLFVLPGTRGIALKGMRLEAVHFNMRFVKNYVALHSLDLRRAITTNGGVLQTICGGHRQMNDYSTCGAVSSKPWIEFKKLGKSYVCPACYALWR